MPRAPAILAALALAAWGGAFLVDGRWTTLILVLAGLGAAIVALNLHTASKSGSRWSWLADLLPPW
jgi:hypothetical protein